jgi:hypothetical protein
MKNKNNTIIKDEIKKNDNFYKMVKKKNSKIMKTKLKNITPSI